MSGYVIAVIIGFVALAALALVAYALPSDSRTGQRVVFRPSLSGVRCCPVGDAAVISEISLCVWPATPTYTSRCHRPRGGTC
jgi:hypothetical protein